MSIKIPKTIRTLVIILGDQLDLESVAMEDFDPQKDMICMAEVTGESNYVWSSKIRTTLYEPF